MHSAIKQLSEWVQSVCLLERLCHWFAIKHNMIPVIGIELEFYIVQQKEKIIHNSYDIIRERGVEQYEIRLKPSEPKDAVNDLLNIISEINQCVNLNPRPFKNDYGNALQFNVSFTDKNCASINLFNDSSFLERACSGICELMIGTFLVFANTNEDFLRFDKYFMSPTHVSYGHNNRSAALRIPYLGARRIEHRLGNPTNCPYLCILTILLSIKYGMENDIARSYIVYGNASEGQYSMDPLPNSLAAAEAMFKYDLYLNLLDLFTNS